MEDTWDYWTKTICSYVKQFKTHPTVEDVNWEINLIEGNDIPFEKFNFATLEEMLQKIPGLETYKKLTKTYVRLVSENRLGLVKRLSLVKTLTPAAIETNIKEEELDDGLECQSVETKPVESVSIKKIQLDKVEPITLTPIKRKSGAFPNNILIGKREKLDNVRKTLKLDKKETDPVPVQKIKIRRISPMKDSNRNNYRKQENLNMGENKMDLETIISTAVNKIRRISPMRDSIRDNNIKKEKLYTSKFRNIGEQNVDSEIINSTPVKKIKLISPMRNYREKNVKKENLDTCQNMDTGETDVDLEIINRTAVNEISQQPNGLLSTIRNIPVVNSMQTHNNQQLIQANKKKNKKNNLVVQQYSTQSVTQITNESQIPQCPLIPMYNPLHNLGLTVPEIKHFLFLWNTKNPFLRLHGYTTLRNIPTPVYNIYKQNSNGFYATVAVDLAIYNSFPLISETEDGARNTVANVALQYLLGENLLS